MPSNNRVLTCPKDIWRTLWLCVTCNASRTFCLIPQVECFSQIHAFAQPLFPSFYGSVPLPVSLPILSHIYAGVQLLNKKRQNNRKISTEVNSIYRCQHGRFKGRSHRSFSITRDFQATVFFESHGNTDVKFQLLLRYNKYFFLFI